MPNTSWIRFLASNRSETSPWKTSLTPPNCTISSLTSPARRRFDRQLTATVAPRLASSSAMERPMPRDAPVISATLPARDFEAGTMISDKVAVATACSFLFYVISSLTERWQRYLARRRYTSSPERISRRSGAIHGSLSPSQLRQWLQEDGQERCRCRWGLSFPAVDLAPCEQPAPALRMPRWLR